MADRPIHGNRSVFSASAALECIARALSEIKTQDRLTYADIGAVLGKSEDQAAKYCDGSATMDAVTFARGKREWNGRFTGYLDLLCEESRPGSVCDHSGQSALLAATLALSQALEDGQITANEVRACRAQIEAAIDALNGQLAKLRVGEVA